jgi:upstream activation factor subunit UAF30
LNKGNDKEEKKRTGGGFTKLCSLSPDLQGLVGETALARTEVHYLLLSCLWINKI